MTPATDRRRRGPARPAPSCLRRVRRAAAATGSARSAGRALRRAVRPARGRRPGRRRRRRRRRCGRRPVRRSAAGTWTPTATAPLCGAKAPLPRDHLVLRRRRGSAAVSDRGRAPPPQRGRRRGARGRRPTLGGPRGLRRRLQRPQDSDVASLAAAERPPTRWAPGRVGLADGSARVAALGAGSPTPRPRPPRPPPPRTRRPPRRRTRRRARSSPRVVQGAAGRGRRGRGQPRVLAAGRRRAAAAHDRRLRGRPADRRGRPRAEAEAGPQAHAITRWLGVDSPDQSPPADHPRGGRAGWLLLCSDGLWNYCSEPAAMRDVVAPSLAHGRRCAAGDGRRPGRLGQRAGRA